MLRGAIARMSADSDAYRETSPVTGRMSKKICASMIAVGSGSFIQERNVCRQPATVWRQRGLVAMTSPGQRGKPIRSMPSVSAVARSAYHRSDALPESSTMIAVSWSAPSPASSRPSDPMATTQYGAGAGPRSSSASATRRRMAASATAEVARPMSSALTSLVTSCSTSRGRREATATTPSVVGCRAMSAASCTGLACPSLSRSPAEMRPSGAPEASTIGR